MNKTNRYLLGLASLLLCLIHVSSFSPTQFSPSALSSSSSLHAYHFGAGAVNTEKPTAKQRFTSYVPDGLSEEEYKKIKSEESRKQQQMNYGAWGPRFKQVDGDPDNNWFNMPSLWTKGFNSNPNALLSSRSADIGETATQHATLLSSMIVNIRRFLLPYLTLLLSIHFLEASITAKNMLQPILRGKLILSKYMIIRVLAPMLALKPLDLLASKFLGWSDKNGTTKLAFAVGLVLSTVSLVLQRRV